jgi:outer membrane protein assembly factor BamB
MTRILGRILPFCLFVCLVSCITVSGGASNWTQMGRDAGHSSASLDSIEPPLKIVWSFDLGYRNSYPDFPPVVDDGVVYASGITIDGTNVQSWIFALNASTGNLLWKHRGTGPLAVSKGILIGLKDRPTYGIVAIRNGTELWTQPMETTDAPIILGPTVVAGQVTALDLKTGTILWHYDPEMQQEDVDHIVSNWVRPLSAENRTVVVATQHVITYYPGHPTTPIALPEPKPGEDPLYPPPEPSEYATTFAALDLTTGTKIWKIRVPVTIESTPIINGGRIFFGSNGSVQAYALDSGELLWKQSFTGFQRTLVTGNGLVFVDESSGQNIRALSIEDGSMLWTYVSDISSRHLMLSGGILYCSGSPVYPSHRHVLEAVNISTGVRLWQGLQTVQYLSLSQLVTDDSLMFITTSEGQLYALASTHVDTFEEIGSSQVTFTAVGEPSHAVGTPSFGIALAIIALIGVVVITRRRGGR